MQYKSEHLFEIFKFHNGGRRKGEKKLLLGVIVSRWYYVYVPIFVFGKTKIFVIEIIKNCYGETVRKLVRKFERTDLRCLNF